MLGADAMPNVEPLNTPLSGGASVSVDTAPPDPDALLIETQAAQLLNLTPRALQSWRARDCGPPYIRISSRCIRYRRKDVVAWAQTLIEDSNAD